MIRNKNTKSEIFRFIITGLISVIFDFTVYTLLCRLWVNVAVAKGVSFFIGAVVGFILNKHWTFESRKATAVKKEIPKYVLLYACTAFINATVNALALRFTLLEGVKNLYISTINIGDYSNISYIFGFIAATAVSMVLNFIGLKFFVFRRKEDLKSER